MNTNPIIGNSCIEDHYTDFWMKRLGIHFYPSEFLVRTMLSNNCPNLKIDQKYAGKNVLDLGCGDGRNMGLLSNLEMNVYGTEITEIICKSVMRRLAGFGIKADIRVGRNNRLPFSDSLFDYIVASASVYYVDAETSFNNNIKEVMRVLRHGGFIIFSMVHPDSYILKDAKIMSDHHYEITNDPLGLRNGYAFKVFPDRGHILEYFSKYFTDISIGYTSDDYYGLKQDLWLIVAKYNKGL